MGNRTCEEEHKGGVRGHVSEDAGCGGMERAIPRGFGSVFLQETSMSTLHINETTTISRWTERSPRTVLAKHQIVKLKKS
jgi:hypothetical protein